MQEPSYRSKNKSEFDIQLPESEDGSEVDKLNLDYYNQTKQILEGKISLIKRKLDANPVSQIYVDDAGLVEGVVAKDDNREIVPDRDQILYHDFYKSKLKRLEQELESIIGILSKIEGSKEYLIKELNKTFDSENDKGIGYTSFLAAQVETAKLILAKYFPEETSENWQEISFVKVKLAQFLTSLELHKEAVEVLNPLVYDNKLSLVPTFYEFYSDRVEGVSLCKDAIEGTVYNLVSQGEFDKAVNVLDGVISKTVDQAKVAEQTTRKVLLSRTGENGQSLKEAPNVKYVLAEAINPVIWLKLQQVDCLIKKFASSNDKQYLGQAQKLFDFINHEVAAQIEEQLELRIKDKAAEISNEEYNYIFERFIEIKNQVVEQTGPISNGAWDFYRDLLEKLSKTEENLKPLNNDKLAIKQTPTYFSLEKLVRPFNENDFVLKNVYDQLLGSLEGVLVVGRKLSALQNQPDINSNQFTRLHEELLETKTHSSQILKAKMDLLRAYALTQVNMPQAKALYKKWNATDEAFAADTLSITNTKDTNNKEFDGVGGQAIMVANDFEGFNILTIAQLGLVNCNLLELIQKHRDEKYNELNLDLDKNIFARKLELFVNNFLNKNFGTSETRKGLEEMNYRNSAQKFIEYLKTEKFDPESDIVQDFLNLNRKFLVINL